MRTTYVVLLMVLGAASSYGIDLGISGGIRDWENTSRADERFTPQMALTVGQTITPNSAVRVDAVAAAWTHESNELEHDLHGWVSHSDRVERSGYAFGARVVFDNRKLGTNGGRLVRPYVGAGIHWAAEKRLTPPWYFGVHREYWYDRWDAEGILGIAVPTGSKADFLIQYAISGPWTDLENDSHWGHAVHSVSLGYRFAVR